MTQQEITEKWNEICFLLTDSIKRNIPEKDYETQIVRAIETLGWREYSNEIERQPTLKFGRGNIRPDVVLYGPDRRSLVVIEVKRPSEDITKEEPGGQLISYMLQTKAEFGLLIGKRIRLYYDGNLNKQQMPLLLDRISFEKNSEKGSMFVSIFNKDDFLNKRYIPQIQKLIESYTEAYNIKKLQEKLLSRQTKSEIISFLKDRYSDYGPDVIEGALNSINIELSRMQDVEDTTNGERLPHAEGLLQTVFSSIKLYKGGIGMSELVKITGYQKKQIRNALYKLTKRDAVAALERGIYVAKTKSIPPKPAKSQKGNSASYSVTKGSLRERAYKLIKRRKSGFTVEEIRQEMGLDYKQVSNILYYLGRRGLVNAKERGLYVAV